MEKTGLDVNDLHRTVANSQPDTIQRNSTMFLKKNWIPLTVFVVAMCGVGLYYIQTRPPRPIVMYEPYKPAPHIHADNPLPYGNVDIRDFEAAKAAMIENINFIKANWDPEAFFDKELGCEMRVAYARATNIANAAMSGIYTREQAREMNALYFDLGISDMIGNAADEIVQRQGAK